MKEKEKILILSGSFGDGHNQVAKAISDMVECSLPGVEPVTIDVMKWMHPNLNMISQYVYKFGIKRFPQVYRYLYSKTRDSSQFSIKLYSLFLLGAKALLDIIEEIKPAIIVSTYPFASGTVAKLKDQELITVPTVTIITDYTYHSYWIQPNTDRYLVGSASIRDQLIEQGVEANKVKDTGIPVRPAFLNQVPKEQLYSKYKLQSNVFTILLMGGGDGFFDKSASILQALESISSTIQLVFVCGRNKKLKRRLERNAPKSKHHVVILGFQENIQELMAISNLLITKPGGVTVTEAVVMNLPLLIYQPLPGQEEDNARFLSQSGLAFRAENERDLISKIESLSTDSKELRLLKARLKDFHTKSTIMDSLKAIVQTIPMDSQEIS